MAVNHRPTRENSARYLWAAVTTLGVLVALAVGALLHDRGPGHAGLWDARRAATSLTYEGQIWAARGEPVDFPEEQMVIVGRTREGYDLYANKQQGYPGGGGGGGRIKERQPWGRPYLKTLDGRYQPLVQSSFTREELKRDMRQ